MELLRLSIRQTSALIGIESPRGQWDIQSKQGQLDISSRPADLQIHQSPGELQIDSSEAVKALALGGPIETGLMLTSQAKERTLEAIGRIAEKGNRMAQITNPRNAVAEFAEQSMEDDPEGLRVAGEPAYDNVKLNYTPHPAEINCNPEHPQIEYTPSKPEMTYTPGKVKVYMDKMNSIRMWVSQYDLYA
jgi:hypothetical protein